MRSLMPNKMPRDLSDRIQWLNSSGETVPAYGVVRLFSYDDATNQFQADKPDGSSGVYYPNGGVSTVGDEYSASPLWNLPRRCLVDSLSYNVGDTVGPVSGQWGMGSAGSGFKIFRPPNADKVAVVQMEGNGGSGGGIHGIVSESHSKGYYTVELAEWAGVTPDCEITECSPCGQATGSQSTSADDSCADIVLPDFDQQLVGTGVFVLAYHRASVLVPLQVGSDCLMMDLGDSNSTGSVSGSSGGGDEPVYQIIDGFQAHTVQYVDTYGCCGTGEDVLISRKAIIFAALECDVAICDPCVEGG